jgi:hypothetical protein
MGLMDKVRAQATQIAQMTQETARDSKAKFDQAQANRRGDALLRNLGAVVYADRTGRGGEDTEAQIDKLISDISAHEAENGISLAQRADQPQASGPGEAAPSSPEAGPASSPPVPDAGVTVPGDVAPEPGDVAPEPGNAGPEPGGAVPGPGGAGPESGGAAFVPGAGGGTFFPGSAGPEPFSGSGSATPAPDSGSSQS